MLGAGEASEQPMGLCWWRRVAGDHSANFMPFADHCGQLI